MRPTPSTRPAVSSAMFAALVTVATVVLHVPAPTGFFHLGDGLGLLAGMLLGAHWGAAAAGLGSALADLVLGFPLYAPASLVIKGVMAALCGLLARRPPAKGREPTLPRLILSALCGGAWMSGGYYLYDSAVLRLGGGSLAALPGNMLQGLVGAAVSVTLCRLLWQVPALRQRFWKG